MNWVPISLASPLLNNSFGAEQMTRTMKNVLLPVLLLGGLLIADMPQADAFGGRGAARRAARRANAVAVSPTIVQAPVYRAPVIQPVYQAPVLRTTSVTSYRVAVPVRTYVPVQSYVPVTTSYYSSSKVGILPTPIFSGKRHSLHHGW